MAPSITSGPLVAPVTALVALPSGDVLTGRGGQLALRLAASGRVQTWEIFSTHAIHGIKLLGTTEGPGAESARIVIFGDKAVAVAKIECKTSSRSSSSSSSGGGQDGTRTLVITYALSRLDDLVLDCSVAPSLSSEVLAIGFAHNFVDYFLLPTEKPGHSDVSDAVLVAPIALGRVRSHEPCVLFSLSFAPTTMTNGIDSNSTSRALLVASGTAFGKISLWLAPLPSDSSTKASTQGQHLCSMSSHEGVIFRLVWHLPQTLQARLDRCNSQSIPESDAGMKCLLASCSDDRTVRLWRVDLAAALQGECASAELFTGWGHCARVWDVTFLLVKSTTRQSGSGSSAVVYLASSSEDGTVKLWGISINQANKAINLCDMTGHSHHVWRMALLGGAREVIIISASDTLELRVEDLRGLCLVTGGNEGSLKSWDLGQQMGVDWVGLIPDWPLPLPLPPLVAESGVGVLTATCPAVGQDDAATNKGDDDAPYVDAVAAKPSPSSTQTFRRPHTVSGLRLSPDGQLIVAALADGGIWAVSVCDYSWKPLVHMGRSIMAVDCLFPSATTVKEPSTLLVLTAHPAGVLSLAAIRYQRGTCAYTEFEISYRRSWFRGRNLVNVWLLASIDSAGVWAVSGAILGEVKVWAVADGVWGPGNAEDAEAAQPLPQSAARHVSLCGTCSTHSGEIASTAAFLGHEIVYTGIRRHRFLCVGDVRGGMTLFRVDIALSASGLSGRESGHSLTAVLRLHHVHNREPVQALLSLHAASTTIPSDGPEAGCFESTLLSAGNDGTLVTLKVAVTPGQSTDPPQLFITLISTAPTLPVRAPDALFLLGHSSESNGSSSSSMLGDATVFISGYQANTHYITSAEQPPYQLMVNPGGGRRRPHCAGVYYPENSDILHCEQVRGGAVPSSIFACPVLINNQTHLSIHTRTGSINRDPTSTLQALPALPPALLPGCTGRTLYAASALPGFSNQLHDELHVAVGGEDGFVQILTSAPSASSLLRSVQTLHMPMNVPVKTLSVVSTPTAHSQQSRLFQGATSASVVASASKRGLVLAAGGRLQCAIYSYEYANTSPCPSPATYGMAALHYEAAGSILPDAFDSIVAISAPIVASTEVNNSTCAREDANAGEGADVDASSDQSIAAKANDKSTGKGKGKVKVKVKPPKGPGPGAGTEQDHRILCSAVQRLEADYLSPAPTQHKSSSTSINSADDDSFLSFLGDSRGVVTILSVQLLPKDTCLEPLFQSSSDGREDDEPRKQPHNGGGGHTSSQPPHHRTGTRVRLLRSLSVSEYPVLSMVVLSVPVDSAKFGKKGSGSGTRYFLLLVGDTAGTAAMWVLSFNRVASSLAAADAAEASEELVGCQCVSSFTFCPHDCGTNALWASIEPLRRASVSGNAASYTIIVASGGDDQMLSVCLGELQLAGPDAVWTWTRRGWATRAVSGAAVMSVLGVPNLSASSAHVAELGEIRLLCLAADQRVTFWVLDMQSLMGLGLEPAVASTKRSARADLNVRFLAGSVTCIGDPAELCLLPQTSQAGADDGSIERDNLRSSVRLVVAGEGVQCLRLQQPEGVV